MNILIFLMVTIYVLACAFLIFIILIQSGKGGGLSSLGSSSSGISDAFGTTGAERTLNKLTTISAVTFMVLAILISLAVSHEAHQNAEIIGERGATEAPLSPDPAGASGAGMQDVDEAPIAPAQPEPPAE